MPEVASTTIRLLLEVETEGLIGGTIPINGMSKTLRRSSNAAAEAVLHATTINFTLPELSDVNISVYDISGRLINTLVKFLEVIL